MKNANARLLIPQSPPWLQIACVLIDEVHLLSENRGAALEAGAVCRIKMVSKYHDLHQVELGLWMAPPKSLSSSCPRLQL